MVLTHLVLFRFLAGATAAAAPASFSGFLSLPPYAFYSGFSGAEGVVVSARPEFQGFLRNVGRVGKG